MAKSAESPTAPVLVIGMGRFGSSVAKSLVRLGHEVLAIDERPDIVQKFAGEFTHIVAADSTDTEALRQVGAEQFRRAVVGIGTDIEASVLTVLSLSDLGVVLVLGGVLAGQPAAVSALRRQVRGLLVQGRAQKASTLLVGPDTISSSDCAIGVSGRA